MNHIPVKELKLSIIKIIIIIKKYIIDIIVLISVTHSQNKTSLLANGMFALLSNGNEVN